MLDLAMHERARLGITLAWQEPARIEGLSVPDYLRLGNHAADPAVCLEPVALEPSAYLGRGLDKTLSGGERRRIELAAVLAMKPRLAILDEPTAGIDLLSLEEVVGVIRGMATEGRSVLLITHEERVAAMADSAPPSSAAVASSAGARSIRCWRAIRAVTACAATGRPATMTDLAPLTSALRLIGEDPAQVLGPETAHLVAYGHDLISRADVPGLTMDVASNADGIRARIQVERGAQISNAVHLCFGLFQLQGVQNIDLELRLMAGSCATFWSHCLFARAEHARHTMNARVEIEEGANLTYQEAHYHGASGDIEVTPRASIRLGPRARYRADFSLVQGRVGHLDIDYEVNVGAEAVAELTSKVYGHRNDRIRIREAVRLNGERARGLIRSRIAADGDSCAEVLGITEGNAAYARGHVDCLEIVRERAQVSALPEVRVTHPLAKVTHEAAIGSVDHRQLETLMSRGIAPEEAVDIIVRGMLR